MSATIDGEGRGEAVAFGVTGERCRNCGFELAIDQRYCVNCGNRRTGPRVDYRSILGEDAPSVATPEAAAAAPPTAQLAADTRAVSPLGAAVALGLVLLAVMLGAIIGKGAADSGKPLVVGGTQGAAQTSTDAAAPAGPATTTETTATTPTPSGSAGSSNTSKAPASAAGGAYGEKSTELKGLMATGN